MEPIWKKVTSVFIDALDHMREATLDAADRHRPKMSVNPDHWPYKVWQWWLADRKPQKTMQLNFCNYWRVVLILAPSWWARKKIEPFIGTRLALEVVLMAVAAAVGSAVTWAAIYHHAGFMETLTGLGMLVFAVVYSIPTRFLLRCMVRVFDKERDHPDLQRLKSLPLWLRIVYFAVCGSVAGVLFSLLLLVYGICIAVAYPFAELEIHVKIAKAVNVMSKAVVRVLNFHPERFWWLRAWIVLPPVAWVAYVVYVLWHAGSDAAWLFFIAFGSTLVAGGFVVTLVGIAIERALEQRSLRNRVAFINSIPGFQEWLLNDDHWEAQHVRLRYGLSSSATAEDCAQRLTWTVLDEMAVTFARQAPTVDDLLPHLPIHIAKMVKPDHYVRLKATRRRVKIFFVGTWKFICLLWAGAVFAKRVGACPLLVVEQPQPPTAPNEPAAN